jgi:hypothetical protein
MFPFDLLKGMALNINLLQHIIERAFQHQNLCLHRGTGAERERYLRVYMLAREFRVAPYPEENLRVHSRSGDEASHHAKE